MVDFIEFILKVVMFIMGFVAIFSIYRLLEEGVFGDLGEFWEEIKEYFKWLFKIK